MWEQFVPKKIPLLGHQSVKVTQKYYAAWTDARQRQEADLERVRARSDRAYGNEGYAEVTRRQSDR
jgi:hypothetical protein